MYLASQVAAGSGSVVRAEWATFRANQVYSLDKMQALGGALYLTRSKPGC